MAESRPVDIAVPDPATILVVEDEVLIRMMLAEELRSAAFVVLEAGSADEAIALIEAVPEIALVFTDIRMPGSIDGLALAQWIRATRPDVKVILSSADQAMAQASSWDAVIMKPYDINALLRSVGRLLGWESRSPADAAGAPAGHLGELTPSEPAGPPPDEQPNPDSGCGSGAP